MEHNAQPSQKDQIMKHNVQPSKDTPSRRSFLRKGLVVAHELRNEIVEELIADRVSESCAEQDTPLVRGGRTRGMESEKGRRGGESRKSQEKRP